MAGDWIRMRVWLSRDPKVIRMADWIAEQRDFMNWLTDPVQRSCDRTAYEHVTRNVTVALCVTGLLTVWGTAREQGDRDGEDLVLDQCDADTLSAVADIPSFGAAMLEVGWIEESEDGRVIFPKFFKDHESPEDRHRRQNADRQARHREKVSQKNNGANNVTSNVTVTPREEKRREKINTRADALSIEDLVKDGVSEGTAAEFIQHRKAKRAKLTPTAWGGIKAEAVKAGWPVERAVQKILARGWTGFEAAWVQSEKPAERPAWEGAK